MRIVLSRLLCNAARQDSRLYILSGDHGYALFDEVRRERPHQFINVGVCEQAMIGYASGMMKVGLRTIVYGLSAFIPIRVLEQIKLDLCLSGRPAILLGDGGGVVYTTLGASHQCAEDIAALRPLANITIYSPCDRFELETCFEEALTADRPVYIRIGKSDRPSVHNAKPMHSGIHTIHSGKATSVALVATGSMASIALEIARTAGVCAYSVSRIKPLDDLGDLKHYRHLIVIEEHSKYGGLFSTLSELITQDLACQTKLTSLSLSERYAEKCGSYQYALSEHRMSDADLLERVTSRISELGNVSS